MSSNKRQHGRKPRKGEQAKRKQRNEKRKAAKKIRDNGAGPRSIDEPQRHKRS